MAVSICFSGHFDEFALCVCVLPLKLARPIGNIEPIMWHRVFAIISMVEKNKKKKRSKIYDAVSYMKLTDEMKLWYLVDLYAFWRKKHTHTHTHN